MAKNTQLSNLAVNTEADALGALLNSGLLRIYDGTQPATADTAITTQVEIPEPVVQIAHSLVQALPDTSNEDLEIALRLRLQHQQIVFKAAYLIFLEQERRALKQREEEVLLLLLH